MGCHRHLTLRFFVRAGLCPTRVAADHNVQDMDTSKQDRSRAIHIPFMSYNEIAEKLYISKINWIIHGKPLFHSALMSGSPDDEAAFWEYFDQIVIIIICSDIFYIPMC